MVYGITSYMYLSPQRETVNSPLLFTTYNLCYQLSVGPSNWSLNTKHHLNLKLFTITDTELKLIAKAASMGLSNNPKKGNKIPAATGTPKVL